MECGAADGELLSNSLLFEMERNWTGLLVEPNKMFFDSLVSKNRKAYSIEACLSVAKNAEKADFHNSGLVGGLAKVETPSAVQDMRIGMTSEEEEETEVQCFPLYPILLSLGNPRVDMFSLDVEGAELDVLRTIPWDEVDIGLIMVEVYHQHMEEIKEFLEGKGYEVAGKVDIGFFNPWPQDLIFVQK